MQLNIIGQIYPIMRYRNNIIETDILQATTKQEHDIFVLKNDQYE